MVLDKSVLVAADDTEDAEYALVYTKHGSEAYCLDGAAAESRSL